MDIMDAARLNIKRRREIRGLRQQDMADKLCMSLRSYQSLESGETKLDIERLEKIAGILDTSMEELLRQDSVYIHQEIQEIKETSYGFIYHQEIGNEIIKKLLASKDKEIQLLSEVNESQKEEIKYLKEKIDQFMEVFGKKG
jgi:transcriptional regulator with XRE-family HTH domain